MNTTEDKAIPVKDGSIPRVVNTSPVPVLGEGFQESKTVPSPKLGESSDSGEDEVLGDGKPSKRRLFGFGKKKDIIKGKGKKKDELHQLSNITEAPNSKAEYRSARTFTNPTMSPKTSTHPYQSHSPPNRILHSSSPRVVSPAGSQIFERDVQETSLPAPNSPAIPSHIQTENHIPPVLDASSEAITDNSLDPDSVEIIMHAAHQPAAVTVTGVGVSEAIGGSWGDDSIAHADKDDTASNYGALDNTDIRRLSFISFADVVQSEHAEHSGMRDSLYIAGLTSLSSGHRSPSPMRSPVSSQGLGTSPPTSKSASIKGVDMSPTRSKPLGSPTASFPLAPGELTIETMSQALRKTGSGDLSGARSQPMSPVSPDGLTDRLLK
jgi:hypothetical protein